MINITDENFEKEVINSEKATLVDFWMNGCPPCSLLSPVLENLENKFSDQIIFTKANVDQAPSAAQRYGINAVPAVILFKQGQPVGGFVGYQTEEKINLWLEESLKKDGKENK
jgi:thioredoxin 1